MSGLDKVAKRSSVFYGKRNMSHTSISSSFSVSRTSEVLAPVWILKLEELFTLFLELFQRTTEIRPRGCRRPCK